MWDARVLPLALVELFLDVKPDHCTPTSKGLVLSCFSVALNVQLLSYSPARHGPQGPKYN